MAVGDARLKDAYDHVLWKEGSTYILQSGDTGLIELENTSLSALLEAAKAIHLNNGDVIAWKKADYVLDAKVTYTSAHNTVRHVAYSNRFRTTIQPATDICCFELQGTNYIEFENLGFASNLATRTQPFIRLKDVCTWNNFLRLYMINNIGSQKGIGIEIDLDTTGQNYYNDFIGCVTRNLSVDYNIDSTGSTTDGVWTTSNSWVNCKSWNPVNFVKVRQRTGTIAQEGHVDHFVFNNCHVQSDANTAIVYDFDQAAYVNVTIAAGNIVWDQPSGAGQLALAVGPRTNINLPGGVIHIENRIGGSGYNNGAKISRNWQTELEGSHQETSNGSKIDYVITHNLGRIPTKCFVTPDSVDAFNAGRVYIVKSTVTDTQMTARFAVPPKSPNPTTVTNNIKLLWKVIY